MKFNVVSKEFKKAVDRVLSIVPSKSSFKILESIRITASGDSVVISGTNLEEFVDVKINAQVISEGSVYVHLNDIKKVYNLPSYDVTIEADNGKISVKNSKKCCEVYTSNYSDDALPSKPVFNFDENPCFRFTERELIFTLDKLKSFLSTGESRPLLTGFNISGKNHLITACDSHRLCTREFSATEFNDSVDITVPGIICKSLKKIGNAKSDREINIYVDTVDGKAKNVCFVGDDYTYISKLLSGDYLNVKNVMTEFTDIEFTMDSKELGSISKEYSKAAKGTEEPMCFIKHNGKLFSAIVLADYQTVDSFETVEGINNIPDNFLIYLSPRFISEVAEVFNTGDIKVRLNFRLSKDNSCCTSGLWFENEDFKSMALPKLGNVSMSENMRKITDKI